MTPTQLEALKIVVEMLDNLMEKTPNKELADVSNYLQEMIDKEE